MTLSRFFQWDVGRVANRRIAASLAIAILVTGCASRPPDAVLLPVDVKEGAGKSIVVLAATTRARAPGSEVAFTADRARMVNYQKYVISIPPNHTAGNIEWPQSTPGNPARDFVVAASQPLDATQFAKAIASGLAADRNKDGSVLVFVHGYNSTFQDAIFRSAEFGADLRSQAGVMVAFAWPSRAALTDYATDRESATYSRDYFEKVLNEIAAVPQVRTINLVAHSMGNFLTVETLRQAKIRGNSPFMKKLGEVVLLAPDIDIDVFRTQLAVIGWLKRPIVVAIARDDRALAVSQRIAGGVSRVGNAQIDNPKIQAAIQHFGLNVVDLSNVEGGDYLQHSKFLGALPELESIATSGEGAHGSTFKPGVFVLNTAGQILQTPARIGDALFQP